MQQISKILSFVTKWLAPISLILLFGYFGSLAINDLLDKESIAGKITDGFLDYTVRPVYQNYLPDIRNLILDFFYSQFSSDDKIISPFNRFVNHLVEGSQEQNKNIIDLVGQMKEKELKDSSMAIPAVKSISNISVCFRLLIQSVLVLFNIDKITLRSLFKQSLSFFVFELALYYFAFRNKIFKNAIFMANELEDKTLKKNSLDILTTEFQITIILLLTLFVAKQHLEKNKIRLDNMKETSDWFKNPLLLIPSLIWTIPLTEAPNNLELPDNWKLHYLANFLVDLYISGGQGPQNDLICLPVPYCQNTLLETIDKNNLRELLSGASGGSDQDARVNYYQIDKTVNMAKALRALILLTLDQPDYYLLGQNPQNQNPKPYPNVAPVIFSAIQEPGIGNNDKDISIAAFESNKKDILSIIIGLINKIYSKSEVNTDPLLFLDNSYFQNANHLSPIPRLICYKTVQNIPGLYESSIIIRATSPKNSNVEEWQPLDDPQAQLPKESPVAFVISPNQIEKLQNAKHSNNNGAKLEILAEVISNLATKPFEELLPDDIIVRFNMGALNQEQRPYCNLSIKDHLRQSETYYQQEQAGIYISNQKATDGLSTDLLDHDHRKLYLSIGYLVRIKDRLVGARTESIIGPNDQYFKKIFERLSLDSLDNIEPIVKQVENYFDAMLKKDLKELHKKLLSDFKTIIASENVRFNRHLRQAGIPICISQDKAPDNDQIKKIIDLEKDKIIGAIEQVLDCYSSIVDQEPDKKASLMNFVNTCANRHRGYRYHNLSQKFKSWILKNLDTDTLVEVIYRPKQELDFKGLLADQKFCRAFLINFIVVASFNPTTVRGSNTINNKKNSNSLLNYILTRELELKLDKENLVKLFPNSRVSFINLPLIASIKTRGSFKRDQGNFKIIDLLKFSNKLLNNTLNAILALEVLTLFLRRFPISGFNPTHFFTKIREIFKFIVEFVNTRVAKDRQISQESTLAISIILTIAVQLIIGILEVFKLAHFYDYGKEVIDQSDKDLKRLFSTKKLLSYLDNKYIKRLDGLISSILVISWIVLAIYNKQEISQKEVSPELGQLEGVLTITLRSSEATDSRQNESFKNSYPHYITNYNYRWFVYSLVTVASALTISLVFSYFIFRNLLRPTIKTQKYQFSPLQNERVYDNSQFVRSLISTFNNRQYLEALIERLIPLILALTNRVPIIQILILQTLFIVPLIGVFFIGFNLIGQICFLIYLYVIGFSTTMIYDTNDLNRLLKQNPNINTIELLSNPEVGLKERGSHYISLRVFLWYLLGVPLPLLTFELEGDLHQWLNGRQKNYLGKFYLLATRLFVIGLIAYEIVYLISTYGKNLGLSERFSSIGEKSLSDNLKDILSGLKSRLLLIPKLIKSITAMIIALTGINDKYSWAITVLLYFWWLIVIVFDALSGFYLISNLVRRANRQFAQMLYLLLTMEKVEDEFRLKNPEKVIEGQLRDIIGRRNQNQYTGFVETQKTKARDSNVRNWQPRLINTPVLTTALGMGYLIRPFYYILHQLEVRLPLRLKRSGFDQLVTGLEGTYTPTFSYYDFVFENPEPGVSWNGAYEEYQKGYLPDGIVGTEREEIIKNLKSLETIMINDLNQDKNPIGSGICLLSIVRLLVLILLNDLMIHNLEIIISWFINLFRLPQQIRHLKALLVNNNYSLLERLCRLFFIGEPLNIHHIRHLTEAIRKSYNKGLSKYFNKGYYYNEDLELLSRILDIEPLSCPNGYPQITPRLHLNDIATRAIEELDQQVLTNNGPQSLQHRSIPSKYTKLKERLSNMTSQEKAQINSKILDSCNSKRNSFWLFSIKRILAKIILMPFTNLNKWKVEPLDRVLVISYRKQEAPDNEKILAKISQLRQTARDQQVSALGLHMVDNKIELVFDKNDRPVFAKTDQFYIMDYKWFWLFSIVLNLRENHDIQSPLNQFDQIIESVIHKDSLGKLAKQDFKNLIKRLLEEQQPCTRFKNSIYLLKEPAPVNLIDFEVNFNRPHGPIIVTKIKKTLNSRTLENLALDLVSNLQFNIPDLKDDKHLWSDDTDHEDKKKQIGQYFGLVLRIVKFYSILETRFSNTKIEQEKQSLIKGYSNSRIRQEEDTINFDNQLPVVGLARGLVIAVREPLEIVSMSSGFINKILHFLNFYDLDNFVLMTDKQLKLKTTHSSSQVGTKSYPLEANWQIENSNILNRHRSDGSSIFEGLKLASDPRTESFILSTFNWRSMIYPINQMPMAIVGPFKIGTIDWQDLFKDSTDPLQETNLTYINLLEQQFSRSQRLRDRDPTNYLRGTLGQIISKCSKYSREIFKKEKPQPKQEPLIKAIPFKDKEQEKLKLIEAYNLDQKLKEKLLKDYDLEELKGKLFKDYDQKEIFKEENNNKEKLFKDYNPEEIFKGDPEENNKEEDFKNQEPLVTEELIVKGIKKTDSPEEQEVEDLDDIEEEEKKLLMQQKEKKILYNIIEQKTLNQADIA